MALVQNVKRVLVHKQLLQSEYYTYYTYKTAL